MTSFFWSSSVAQFQVLGMLLSKYETQNLNLVLLDCPEIFLRDQEARY